MTVCLSNGLQQYYFLMISSICVLFLAYSSVRYFELEEMHVISTVITCLSPEICKFYVRYNILSPFRLREIRHNGGNDCLRGV